MLSLLQFDCLMRQRSPQLNVAYIREEFPPSGVLYVANALCPNIDCETVQNTHSSKGCYEYLPRRPTRQRDMSKSKKISSPCYVTGWGSRALVAQVHNSTKSVLESRDACSQLPLHTIWPSNSYV